MTWTLPKIPSLLGLKTTAIIGVSSLALGMGTGWWLHNALVYKPHLLEDAKVALKGEQAARKTEASGTIISGSVRDKLDADQAATRVVYQTIHDKVPVYVHDIAIQATGPQPTLLATAPTSGPSQGSPGNVLGDRPLGGLPLGFVGVYNSAVLGIDTPLSTSPGFDPDGASGVGLPALASATVTNLGVCRSYLTEVMAWRGWYPQQAALYNALAEGKAK